MQWEVEQKFRLSDVAALRRALAELGAKFEEPIHQVDRYFNHPARDFAKTDEALRLRQVGQKNFITYKGPKIDPTTKTRRELEFGLPDGDHTTVQFVTLLTALGFQQTGTVEKQRVVGGLIWQGEHVDVALDNVSTLGQFLELEITADDRLLDRAKAALETLSSRLSLGPSERRSYLELLMGHKS